MYIFNGAKLKELQESQGLNDIMLADKLKLNPTMIWHYRKGNKQPNLHTTKYIAEYFKVSADDLISEVNPPPQSVEQSPQSDTS